MQLVSTNINFDFMGIRRKVFVVSLLMLVISIGSLVVRGLNFGIDFTGGYLIELGYEQPAELESIRQVLADQGFADAQVQHFGTSREVLLRLAPREGIQATELGSQIQQALETAGGYTLDLRRVEFVGPQVGEELREQGGLAVLYALGLILLYIMFRFEKRFSLGAVAALVHDVLITLGVFSLFAWEFDLSVLAAILAVIGYSLNDTIVVFDRIRENFRRMRKGTSSEIINKSINQTISRTVMTSLTTLLVLTSLAVIGGESIYGFAVALIIGVLVGTYSSIYIASASTLAMGLNKMDLVPVKKEQLESEV